MTQLTSLGLDCSERCPRRTSSASVRRLSLLVAALLTALGTGCSVVELAEGRPGVDFSSLAPGVPRAEVEARLDAPVRSWISAEGVRYSLYEFDMGVPPNVGDAALMAMLTVYTLGLMEVLWAANPPVEESVRVVVSYDANDMVLGLFDEFGCPYVSISGRQIVFQQPQPTTEVRTCGFKHQYDQRE